MQRFILGTALAAIIIVGLNACGDKFTQSPSLTIKTAQGSIQGVTTENPSITNFKGIPYATPPVGDLRWTAPKPAQPWTGIRAADTFSPMCRQPANTEDGFFKKIIDGHGLSSLKKFAIEKVVASQPAAQQSEDCLYLNVRTGGIGSDTPKPVMVWIHGGGHQFGSGDFNYYQGNGLVEHDVVLVTINYRLGVMGYMAHPALSEDDPRGVSGNYGLLDQIEALKWVRENIREYGGDPDNVTIFGESAGAWSVTELMSSPLATGLFHKAIGQSGAATYHLGDLKENPTDWPSGHGTGLAIAKASGLTETASASDLRALSGDTLIAAVTGETAKLSDGLHPVRDGVVLPINVGTAFRSGQINAVPVLFGYNDDEGTLFFDTDPEPSVWIEGFPKSGRAQQAALLEPFYGTDNAKTLLDNYGLSDPDTFRTEGMDFMGDEIFGMNVRYVARQSAKAGQPSYLYIFTRVPPSEKQTIGAFHAAELPFVFDTHEPVLGVTDEDADLTALMQSYWTNFAKTGNPNGDGVMNWPQHDDTYWMQLSANDGKTSGVIENYNEENLDAMEAALMPYLDKIDPSAKTVSATGAFVGE